METLTHEDTQKLHESIQQLYTFGDLNTFGVNALSIVDRLIPGNVPEFHVTNLRTHQISSTFLPDFSGFTPELERLIQSTWGEFTERDRLVLNLLRPHLFQSHQNAQKYHQLEQNMLQVQQSIDGLCTVIVDSQGRVQSIAPQAAILLDIYFETPIHADRLPTHLWSWVKHQTSCLSNKTDLPQASLPLRIQSEERELAIRSIVEPNCDRYMLFLEERMLSCLNSLELLGLSQRETEVLSWVLKGKNNQEIGLQLSVGKSTVGKHLENVYHKLGVQSRTEAISTALEKLGLML